MSGSEDAIYDGVIQFNHPRKSTCTCPFAAGRRVICKHMVALYFFYFPQQPAAILAEWEEVEREKEERYQEWEAEYTMLREEKVAEVTAYVKSLSDDQLREKLIKVLMKEFDADYLDYEEEYGYDDYYF